jgi:hypothetical protein
MDKLEIEFIQKYDSTNPEKGYNVELGGNGIGKHSESTKRKISEAQLGEKNHMYGKKGSLNTTSKRVIDLTTGIIYESASQCAEILNLGTGAFSKVCACARGERHSTYNRVFRYVDENDNPIIVPLPYITKTITTIIDITNNKIYNSINDIVDDTGFSFSGISLVLKGKRKQIRGHVYQYGEEKVIKYCKYNKVFDLILPEYKYIVNTVLSPDYLEKCNDYPEKE